ncbi:MAG: inositol monophosphatase family protein [Planctomycetota bacterium]
MNAEPSPIPAEADRLELARTLARDAGELSLTYFNKPSLQIERKLDGSEVTEADHECERMIRAKLIEKFPQDGIMGEEFEDRRSDSGYRWILDPIDGTFSFARGVPLYSVLIAVEKLENGEPVDAGVRIGVIAMPALCPPGGGSWGEYVYAVRGGGAWHQFGNAEPVRARVSDVTDPEHATTCITTRAHFARNNALDVLERILTATGHSRGWSDAYPAVLLATGRIEAMVEPNMKPWDNGPMQPIIAEAGGVCTDWNRRESIHTGSLLATNGHVHDHILAAIKG